MPKRAEPEQDPIEFVHRRGKSRRDQLLDELLKEYGGSAGVSGPEELLKDLTRVVVIRAMDAELTHHVGCEPGAEPLKSIRIAATGRAARPCVRGKAWFRSRFPETGMEPLNRS